MQNTITWHSVLVHKQLNLGYIYVFGPPGQMITDAMTVLDLIGTYTFLPHPNIGLFFGELAERVKNIGHHNKSPSP